MMTEGSSKIFLQSGVEKLEAWPGIEPTTLDLSPQHGALTPQPAMLIYNLCLKKEICFFRMKLEEYLIVHLDILMQINTEKKVQKQFFQICFIFLLNM